ncbi:rRNA methyltransferase 3, mitochondrial [Zophobas morio]|uniref:rRNA methyltransferase 3, mitochondrial n=1 Tax=Zophobas morio TaxID=2755281 RepID=UPI003082E498
MASTLNIFVKNALKSHVITQQVRFYPRWGHRTPIKVYTPEEFQEMENKQHNPPEKKIFEKYGAFKPAWERSKNVTEDSPDGLKYKFKTKKSDKPLIATHQKSKVSTTTDMLETIIDKDGNFIYTKMKNNDQRVGKILTEVKSKKDTDKKDLVLLEGKRLIKDALQSGCHLKYILFSRKDEVDYLRPFLPKAGALLYKMPYKEMQMWSDLTTTPGIMAIFKLPSVEDFTPKHALPITVICDNIREPGNLGTILRICAAVGCERVILTKGCANLWDSKVLRSSVGAHFKLRLNKSMDWDSIEEIVGKEANFFIADNKLVCGDNIEDLATVLEKIPLLPYYSVDFRTSPQIVVIVGGETLGVSKNSYELALKTNGARLNIPLSNDIDSLNVGAALGIIAFEIKKQLTQIVNK